jgi:branched-chain amino acid transport system substrate-binding protein
MKKMHCSVLCAAVLVFLTFWTGAAFAAAPSGEPIKIGYLATLTGDGSTWGQHERDGALLAIKELNEAGGVLGRPLELIYYDVRGRQEDAIQAARRLVHEDKVVAIGGTNYSGLNIAIASVVNNGKVSQIGTASTNPAVTVDPRTNTVRPYTFRLCYTDPYQGKVMADYLVNKLGVKSAAVITDIGSDYSEGLKEFFVARFEEQGGELKGIWGFRGGDVDFRAQLTEMKATGAEAVALPILYKEMGLIMKQAAELDWKPIFIGGDGFSPSMHEIAGDTMEGSYWVYSMDLGNPQMIYLLSRFEKEYGRPAAEPGNVAYSYDLITWVADAIRRAGNADPVAVRDALEDTQNLRLVHFTLTVDKETHNPLNKPAAMMLWKDARLNFLEMWAPQDKF